MTNRRTFVQSVAALAAGGTLGAGSARAAKTLKCSLYVPLDSLQGKGAQHFKQLVEQKTGKELEIRLFPSNQLGGPYDVIDAQNAGSIEMALLGYDIYAKFSPIVNLAGLPFIFRDRSHAFAFFNGPLHSQGKAEILRAKAVRVIGGSEWQQGPYKILLTRDPVRRTADLKGMSMRVPNNEVDLLVWGAEGAGANVSPIPWQEAQLAIRQGLVKAIELPADFIIPFKFHESAKHLALTRHRHQVVYMTIAEKVWQGLAPAERRALEEANKEAGDAYAASVHAAWAKEQETLKAAGVSIVEFDVSEWHRKAVEIARRLEAKGTWDKGLVDQVLALK
jgi:TRAP-type C4-dicarboxylate transport system substrate-binding protein